MKNALLVLAAVASMVGWGEYTVDVEREGAEKFSVSIDKRLSEAFMKSLRKNLELSGDFVVREPATIRVSAEDGGVIRSTGRGKTLSFVSKAKDPKGLRNEARLLADKMIQTYTGAPGFANDMIAFISKEGRAGELYTCYPDGYDMRRVTSDGKEAVGPRWSNRSKLIYTGFLQSGPQIWEADINTGAKRLVWSFKGLTTGAVISPDGSKAAIILSIHGNPELYVIDIKAGTWVRLTTTLNASEGQPAWSPDGREIVYVSDESRRPHLYVVDVATKKKRRLTSQGAQNVDPDWGKDGQIAYITKRGGNSYVAVLDPKKGDASARLVTNGGSWEHPSWSKDSRHIVASRDKALFIVDTREKDPSAPAILFNNGGKWITPSWSK